MRTLLHRLARASGTARQCRGALAQAPRPHAWAWAAMLLAATWGPLGCGGADAGDGTGTLLVQGTLAADFTTNQTQIDIHVDGTEAARTAAKIALMDVETHEAIDVPAAATPGHYAVAWAGYHRTVGVSIWSGADGLTARIEGPARHTVVSPRPGDVVAEAAPLKVAWAASDGLRSGFVHASLGATGVRHTLERDGGHDVFAAEEMAPGRDSVTVRRHTALVPSGAAAGSMLTSSYAVTVPFLRAEPAPLR